MMEQNTFRSFMLVGGVIAIALIIALMVSVPVVDITAEEHTKYEKLMGEAPKKSDSLTMYETIWYSIEAKTKGKIRHY